MKLSVKYAAVFACSLTLPLCTALRASAEEAAERGKAVYFGQTIEGDDSALLAAGFDETDLSFLNSGQDVTYAVKYATDAPQTYDALPADSLQKQKIDAFFSGNAPSPEDSLLTTYYAVRIRGEEAPETLENIRDAAGTVGLGLLEEQGDVNDFVQNGSFTMLYLEGDQAVQVDADAQPTEQGYVRINFHYIGSGEYIVLYDAAAQSETTHTTTETTTSAQTTAGTSAAATTASAAKSTASAAASTKAPAPNAGAQSSAGLLLALAGVSAAAFVAGKTHTR